MLLRLLAAVAVVAGLTAFAPAPLPKAERKAQRGDLALLQGTWKVVGYERPGIKGGAVKIGTVISNVRIGEGKWTFLRRVGDQLTPTVSYDLKVEPKAAPKRLDLVRDLNGNVLTMRGIYKFEGTQLKVLYVNVFTVRAGLGGGPGPGVMVGSEDPGPLTFENPPSSAILYTLEREP